METTETLILADLKQVARDSHRNLSHDPDRRGDNILKEYSAELEEDLQNVPHDSRQEYTDKYKSMLRSWLHALGNCASAFITGPSNFPTERMRKRSNTADKRYSEFREWREKRLKWIEKARLASRTEDEKDNDQWKVIHANIRSSAQTVIDIDNNEPHARGYARPLFVKSIVGTIETLAKNGRKVLVMRSLNLLRELNNIGPKPIVTDKHSVWSLAEQVVVAQEAIADRAVKENQEIETNGIKVVWNYGEDRVQLFFSGKEHAMKYKKAGLLSGWNWSPTNGAWQRKLTGNAQWAAKKITETII